MTRTDRPRSSRVGRRAGRASRRRRTVLELVLSLLGLAALLYGADLAARTGAESLLARGFQDATGASARPDVEVRGAFFLPQVIRGAYTSVDVTTQGISTGPLRIERVDSHLTDVRVPFHDVLVRDVGRVSIGRTQSEVTLTYGDLTSYLRQTGRPLTLAAADDGTVRIDGTLDLLTEQVDATAVVALSVDGGALRVRPTQIEGGEDLSSLKQLLLGQRLAFTVPLDTLPFGLQLTRVTADATHVEVGVQGTRVVVDP